MKLTLCGSLKFEPYWHEANKQLGLAGHICYSVMTFPSIEGAKSWYTDEQKWTLDLAHLAKIEESEGVVMLNIAGYLGESSMRELEWARMRDKKVFWTEENHRLFWRADGWARELAGHYIGHDRRWVELFDGVEARKCP